VAFCVNVITHLSTNVDELSIAQLRRIYAKRQLPWENGLAIVIVSLKPPPMEVVIVFDLPSHHQLDQKFSIQILGNFPDQFDPIWNKSTHSVMATARLTRVSAGIYGRYNSCIGFRV